MEDEISKLFRALVVAGLYCPRYEGKTLYTDDVRIVIGMGPIEGIEVFDLDEDEEDAIVNDLPMAEIKDNGYSSTYRTQWFGDRAFGYVLKQLLGCVSLGLDTIPKVGRVFPPTKTLDVWLLNRKSA
jgi:hypothetical protein